jgi:phosphoserine phosphatase
MNPKRIKGVSMNQAKRGSADKLLSSWNDGAAKQAIVDFVGRVTTEGGPDYVPTEDRIATFDNDGTLWCEKPMYIQLDFILRRLAVMAEQDSSLHERQPWKAAREKDYDWLGGAVTKYYQGDDSDIKIMLGGTLQAFAEMTIEAFEAAAGAFLNNERHPTLGRPYLECGYRPMVELLRYLEAGGFTNYIVSGGGRDFMRPITEKMYGIPRERVIGSTVSLHYQPDASGGTVVREAALDVMDDGPEKPVRIWNQIGRRPILAAGNSNGDIPMLEYVSHPSRPSLSLLVNHDDEREFAYTAGAEESLEEASRRGWVVVSMKNDWNRVFDSTGRGRKF